VNSYIKVICLILVATLLFLCFGVLFEIKIEVICLLLLATLWLTCF
jgi:hypothetical protein